MKQSLKHLPKSKQQELQKIIAAIKKTSNDVQKIILFGSYARGNYKEKKDIKPEARTGHVSDYDILVVTGSKKTVDLFVFCDDVEKIRLSAPVRIIADDIESLNISLAKGQYLYTDIKKEGIILYDTGKYKLANKRRLKPKEKQRIARDYFNHWFEIAKGFLIHFKFNLELSTKKQRYLSQKYLNLAAFHLHQAAEHSYKTISLVYTSYNPREHYLAALRHDTVKFNRELLTIFLTTTEKEKDRFKLLDYAYIGGRYDPNYRISRQDLLILVKDVKKLLKVTKIICQKKIKSFVTK